MEANNGDVSNKKYCCIKCGKTWGKGELNGSYGVCIDCLADYINEKKISKGMVPCFGKLNQDVVCDSCKLKKFCEEYFNKYN